MFDSLVQSLNNFFSKPPAKTEDALGAYPLEVHVEAYPERRYLWTVRRLAIICIVSLCLNIILGLIATVVAKKVRSHMILGQFVETKNRVIPMLDPEKKSTAVEIYLEKKIVEYIFLMHTVDGDYKTMEKRWGNKAYFFLMSEVTISDVLQKHTGIRLNQLKKNNVTQEVRITNVSKVRQPKKGIHYKIDFMVKRENVPGEKFPQIIMYQAVVKATLSINKVGALTRQLKGLDLNNDIDIQRKKDYELRNPLGFYVRDYREAFSNVRNAKERDILLLEFEKPDEFLTFMQQDMGHEYNPNNPEGL